MIPISRLTLIGHFSVNPEMEAILWRTEMVNFTMELAGQVL